MGPRKSSYHLGKECGILKSSVLRDLKALRFHPYKLSVVQKLIPADPAVCMNFCHWMLQSVHDGIVYPMLLFMSGEAWFLFNVFLMPGTPIIGDTKSPHTIREAPLRDQKVGLYCVVSGWRIIGPIFFFKTW
jgi:hypothetical protein